MRVQDKSAAKCETENLFLYLHVSGPSEATVNRTEKASALPTCLECAKPEPLCIYKIDYHDRPQSFVKKHDFPRPTPFLNKI